MKKRPSIVLLTALLAVVFAAGIGVYSSYIGMKIYQESSNNLFESFSQISKTFTLFVQRNWTVLGQWDGLLKNTGSDADAENIWPDVQGSKESWRYSDFYLLNEDSQYLTADGRKGSAGSISGVIQELYREDGPIVSTYTASYGVPKIVFAMPLSRNITLDGVTYTGLAVSYDTDVVDDLVDGSMYSGQSDRLLQSMSRIVDRYTIVNLDTDRYRYRELRLSKPLYPTSGQYSEMLKTISERYVALTETENAKLSRLLAPEYLRSVLRRPDDNLKIEYCSRTENAYLVLTILPVAWHADGTVYEVMQVVQDIGQKVELENMANTDSMTGLFNERYFSRVLSICEAKKLPFVLYYLDLDRFKPVNDTYGHLMGDRLLKEIAARLLRCIRSRDYAFRIGGDEFALIVSADMDEEQRARMTERIQTTLSAPVVLDGKELSVGVSCGCACYPEDGDASQVRITADSRMYETKQRHHENDRTEGES